MTAPRLRALPLLLSVVCLATISVVAQQKPGTPAAGDARGVISGLVTEDRSGRPVAGALVTLFGGGGRRQVTDAAGRFVFTGLGAGTYAVIAIRFGYFDGGYGRPSSTSRNAANRQIVLGEGEWFSDARITLWRQAAIVGRVLDERGEPVVDVWVRVLSEIFIAGRPQWVTGQLAKTDDRGVYRLAGLTPGRYTVVVPSVQNAVPEDTPLHALRGLTAEAAALREAEGHTLSFREDPSVQVGDHRVLIGTTPIPAPAAAGRPQVYPITFSPSVRTVAEAQVLELSSGEVRGGVDVGLRPVPAFTIAGRLVGPSDESARMVVRLLAAGVPDVGVGAEAATSLAASDGRFLFANVPAGRYTIVTSPSISWYRHEPATFLNIVTSDLPLPPGMMSDSSSSSASAAPSGTSLATRGIRDSPSFGQTEVTIERADVSDMQVVLERGGVISGRVEMEPGLRGSPSPRPLSSIEAESADGDPALGRPAFRFDRAKPSPEFRIQGIKPGAYLLRVAGGGLIRSVQYDRRDYTDRPLEIAGAQEISGVVVTLTQQGAQLTGYVRDVQGRPATSHSVVLCFPEDSDRWSRYGIQPNRLRATTVGDDGNYQVTNLPGGNYLLVALDASHADAWHDSAFLAKVAPLAAKVTLGWGEKRSESLTLLPLR